jgi:hypothetical protein
MKRKVEGKMKKVKMKEKKLTKVKTTKGKQRWEEN